jgi:electron transfer flavoprotein alpha subunit
MADVLVYLENAEGAIHDVSWQALAKAREIAGHLGGRAEALLVGSCVKPLAETAAQRGAERVYLAEDARLKNFVPMPYKKIISSFLKTKSYPLVLMAGTCQGTDLAPLAAAECDAGCLLDAERVEVKDQTVIARRSGFEGKVVGWFRSSGKRPLIVSVKDGIAEAPERNAALKPQQENLSVSLKEQDFPSQVTRREIAKSTVNLKAAKVIVSAGAGVGTKENFALISDLARLLNAEIGATRPVVDAGWTTADRQIGQTGVTVKPDLYIACGISGAIQHRVGMAGAKKIVAINTDPAAPIFRHAHYKITGDLKDAIPKLIKLLS